MPAVTAPRAPGARLVLSVGAGAVHVRAEDDALCWSFDPVGRPLAGHGPGGLHLRFGLDGAVLARAPDLSQPPVRLPARDAQAAAAEVAALAGRAAAALAAGAAVVPPDAAAEARRVLLRAAARDAAARREDAARFARAYGRVPILPPDCARALVVRAVEGCPWARCAFCTLYAGVPFHAKDDAALEAHLDEVEALLGEAAALRTRVFLGDANALLAPRDRLLRLLPRVAARFPGPARGGFHTFVDAFTRPVPVADLAALRAAGLARVTVGLESGHAPLLAWLNKPATPADVVALVARARAAGLGVGVVVLVGAGGAAFEAAHVADTLACVDAMGLGPGDLVWLSPLVAGAPAYAALGAAPLDPDRLAAQGAALREGLRARGVRAAAYDLRRFVH